MKKFSILLAVTALVITTLACQQNVVPASDSALISATATPIVSPTVQVLVANLSLPTDPVFVDEKFNVSWDCPGATSVTLNIVGDAVMQAKGTRKVSLSQPGVKTVDLTCMWPLGTSVVQNGVITVIANPDAPTQTQAVAPTTSVLVVESNDSPTVTDSNGWKITYFAGADLDRGDGTTFRNDTDKWTLLEISPELWPTFPDHPNPLVPEFRVVKCADDPTKDCVPDGLENVMQETNFCQQLAGEKCRVPVAAEHYLYFSGDYDIPGIGSCSEAETGYGCLLVVVNVGKVTSDLNGVFGQGFRIHARYWNGQKLDQAMWALTSHGANSMMNLNSKLNPQGIQNAGANCSVPEGCHGVHVQVVFVSGNEPLLDLTTTVTK